MIKVSRLYDQGDAKFMEDAHHVMTCGEDGVMACAFDGVSEVYVPDTGPTMFDGMTGGQISAEFALYETILCARKTIGLDKLLLRDINNRLAGFANGNCISLDQSDLLPGVVGGVVRVKDKVEIAVVGDVTVMCIDEENTADPVAVVENRNKAYEKKMGERITYLMEQYEGDQRKMWAEFAPFLAESKLEHCNKKKSNFGYGVLNGQKGANDFLVTHTIPRKKSLLILMLTDGLCTHLLNSFGPKFIWTLYLSGGLPKILRTERALERGLKAKTHATYQEATGIAIKL